MVLQVEIFKQLGDFRLEAQFETDGSPLALLGGSGSGKSLTLRCIAGILTPDAGRITLGGRTLFDSAAGIDLPPQRRRVGYLFQNYALFPHMSVAENVAVAIPKGRRRTEVPALLEKLHLTAVAHQRPGQISGGEQQRTALARILGSGAEALLLDEPFSALDSYLKWRVEQELADVLADFAGPVVWVSHDRSEVYRNCPRVCVMDGGRSQGAVDMEDLFRDPVTVSAARLSGCKNYVDAVPFEDCVDIFDWKLRLFCGRTPPPETNTVGLRSHHIRFAAPGSENSFSCTVERLIQDVFETILLLRPVGAQPDAPLLRMELKKVLSPPRAGERVTVSIAPGDILLLH